MYNYTTKLSLGGSDNVHGSMLTLIASNYPRRGSTLNPPLISGHRVVRA